MLAQLRTMNMRNFRYWRHANIGYPIGSNLSRVYTTAAESRRGIVVVYCGRRISRRYYLGD